MKLTEWYSGDQKPVRVGVYQRDYDKSSIYLGSGVQYCLWNGNDWRQGTSGAHDASFSSPLRSLAQNLPWRGMAK